MCHVSIPGYSRDERIFFIFASIEYRRVQLVQWLRRFWKLYHESEAFSTADVKYYQFGVDLLHILAKLVSPGIVAAVYYLVR